MRLQLNLVTLLVAWGISEVIRYGFFALKVRACAPGGRQPRLQNYACFLHRHALMAHTLLLQGQAGEYEGWKSMSKLFECSCPANHGPLNFSLLPAGTWVAGAPGVCALLRALATLHRLYRAVPSGRCFRAHHGLPGPSDNPEHRCANQGRGTRGFIVQARLSAHNVARGAGVGKPKQGWAQEWASQSRAGRKKQQACQFLCTHEHASIACAQAAPTSWWKTLKGSWCNATATNHLCQMTGGGPIFVPLGLHAHFALPCCGPQCGGACAAVLQACSPCTCPTP